MLYDYKYTDDKGGYVEIEHSMREDARTEHDGRPVERVISREAGRAISFRGGDWTGRSVKSVWDDPSYADNGMGGAHRDAATRDKPTNTKQAKRAKRGLTEYTPPGSTKGLDA